jgi:micrococcal nuclease
LGKKVIAGVAGGLGIAAVAIVASGLIPLDSVSQQKSQQQIMSQDCVGNARCFVGTVTNVVDGDTIDVDQTRIRLALVDTPELDEEGYEQAKQFTSSLCLVGSQVVVDQDDGQLQDAFGRMVAKVACSDNKNLNAELLRNGHAVAFTEYCNISEFSREEWIRDHGCPVSTGPTNVDTNCDPSYPDVCISPPPPDLDCSDITHRNFRVLQPDPHRFDSERDGLGCES